MVEDAYQAWMWLDQRVASFSTLARRHVGHRALDAILDVVAAVTDATYLPRGARRVARLAEANRGLSLLRILLRGARDRHHLSVDQHEHAMKLIDPIGRQIGGWLRREAGGDGAP